MSDREAFEKWAKEEAKKTSRGFNELTLERDYSSPDYYAKLWVNAAWRGWQASRQALSSYSEIPNHSVTGNAVAMGDLTDNDDEEHERSILIQFGSLEDFYAARASGQCRFTVFGGGV